MSRFALEPDAETDNALSEQPAPARCETCGEDVEGTVYSAGGAYAFCCDACFRAFEQACQAEADASLD